MSETLGNTSPEQLASQELARLGEDFSTAAAEQRPQLVFEMVQQVSTIVDTLTPSELEEVVRDNAADAGNILINMSYLNFELHVATNSVVRSER